MLSHLFKGTQLPDRTGQEPEALFSSASWQSIPCPRLPGPECPCLGLWGSLQSGLTVLSTG